MSFGQLGAGFGRLGLGVTGSGGGGTPADNPALRAPTASDDITKGNLIGRRWLDRVTGDFYLNTYNATGEAQWTNEGPVTALPVQASGVAWTAVYGVKSLTSAWLTGNLFDITRASDSTAQTFAATAGAPSIAAIQSFLSGTTGVISKLYDQSGNAKHITLSANFPGVRIQNGRMSMVGANVVEQGTAGSGAALGVPSSSVNMQAMTIVSVIRSFQSVPIPNTSASSSDQRLWAIYDGSSAGTLFGQALSPTNTNGRQQIVELSFFASFESSVVAETDFAVTGFVGSATDQIQFQNEQLTSAGTQNFGGTVSATSSIGGSNNGSGNWALNDEVYAFMLAGASALSTSALLNTRKSLYTLFATPPQYINDNYVSVGDSITQGYQASSQGQQGWSATTQIQDLLTRPVRVTNFGVSQANIGYLVSTYSRATAAIVSGARSNILRIGIGTNDVGGGAGGGAAAWAALHDYIATALTSFSHVIVDTMPTNSDCDGGAGFETERQSYNALIRSNAAGMGYYVSDVGGSASPVGVPGATSSHPEMFSGDLLHPSTAGQLVIAQYDAAVVNSILAAALFTPPAAQNLILRSEEFATSPWADFIFGNGVTPVVTNNAGVAPNGTTTATLVVLARGTATSSDYSQIQQNYTTTAGAHSHGLWYKAASGGDVGKQISLVSYDTVTVTDIAVVTLTADWQFVPRQNFNVATTTGQISTGLKGTDVSQTGTVSFYTWGAQVSQGATLKTYAKTTTTPVP